MDDMRILICNDDGLHSNGMRNLERELSRDYEVWAVCPDRQRSGTSQAISLRETLRMKEVEEVFAPEYVAKVYPLEKYRFEELVLVSDHILHEELGKSIFTRKPCDILRNVVESPIGLVGTDEDVQRPAGRPLPYFMGHCLTQHACLPSDGN